MAAKLADGQIEVDGRQVGTGIVPTLPELHVELKDFEAHVFDNPARASGPGFHMPVET
jgi:hypothetical protein